ncbi:MAG: tyrosine-type recombinase/integrase [Chthoniobacteraceae bacterium]
MTVAMAIERIMSDVQAQIPMRRRGHKSAITASSTRYRGQNVELLCKTSCEVIGSEFENLEIRKVTAGDVRRWADSYRAHASATRFNNTLGTLRRIFDIAIEAGELHRNPAQDVARSYKKPKVTYTPTREEFVRLVATVRQSHSRIANAATDFVEFLAYTGAQKEEAAHVTWADVDFARDRVTFRVTKNGQSRTNELIADARGLLERMREESVLRPPENRVFSVGEAYGSLRTAAGAIRIPRISHHDLRDLFATTAIESGVDIPTVADWLGHQDGGAPLLERYWKRRDDHAKQSAKRVSFAAR